MKKRFSKDLILFVLSGLLLLGCQQSPKDVADVIYINGKVYTVNETRPWAEAFAVKDGIFIEVGSTEKVERAKGDATKVIDLKGKFVMPGIIDDHIHPDMGADNYLNVFIKATDNWDDVKRKIKDFRNNNPNKKWIYGSTIDWLLDDNGIIANYGVPSNKSVLDEIVDDRPIALWDQGAHAMLLNTMALNELGVTDDSPNPDGGIFVKDKNGKLTGVFRETANTLVLNALDNYSLDEWTHKGMLAFINEMSSYGVTSISDAYAVKRNADAYSILEKEGKLDLWVNLYMATPLEYNKEEKKKAQQEFIANSNHYKSELIYPAGIKYILDGSAAGKTAAMIDPFIGTDFHGHLRYPEEEVRKGIYSDVINGYAIKAHAIGDRGIRLLLDIFEEAEAASSEAMHSIAHGTFVDPDDISRFNEIDVVYEASPALWFPNNGIPIILEDIGEERTRHAWPIKKLIEADALVSYGSDWTVSITPNPWPGLEAMISRKVPGKESDEAFVPTAAVDLATALKIFTLNGAVSMGIDEKTGSIVVGKSADFIVLNEDLFTKEVGDIHSTEVLSTFFRGNEVYSKN